MLVGADEEKMEKIRESMLSLTKGWNQEHIASIVRETLDEIISPIVFAEALELFAEHHAAGRRVVIVSSSPSEVVEPLAEYLGADEAIATRAQLDEDGNYSGELAFYAYGPHKAEAIRAVAARDGLDLAECFAYSDSITDLPMLDPETREQDGLLTVTTDLNNAVANIKAEIAALQNANPAVSTVKPRSVASNWVMSSGKP